MTTCQQYFTLGLAWFPAIIDPPGIVFNALSVACFAQILLHKSGDSSGNNSKANMFKYLFVKATCDLILHSGDVLVLLDWFCGSRCNLNAYPYWWIWYISFDWDFEFILMTMSPFMEIAATLGLHLFIL
jgi:hypothetical protein